MKRVDGENLTAEVIGSRKGRTQTPIAIGVGNVLDQGNEPTNEIRLRTEHVSSGVAPVVATISIESAETLVEGLQLALTKAKKVSGLF